MMRQDQIPDFNADPAARLGRSLNDARALLKSKGPLPIALIFYADFDERSNADAANFVQQFSESVHTMHFHFAPGPLMVQLVAAATNLKKLHCQLSSASEMDMLSNAFTDYGRLESLAIELFRGPIDLAFKDSVIRAVQRFAALTHLELTIYVEEFTLETQSLLSSLAGLKASAPWTLCIKFFLSNQLLNPLLLPAILQLVENKKHKLSLNMALGGVASIFQSEPTRFGQFLNVVALSTGCHLDFDLSGVNQTLASTILKAAASGEICRVSLMGAGLLMKGRALTAMLASIPNAKLQKLQIFDITERESPLADIAGLEGPVVAAVQQNSTLLSVEIWIRANDSSVRAAALLSIVERNKDLAAARCNQVPISLLPKLMQKFGQKKLGSAAAYVLLREHIGPCLGSSAV